MNTWAIPQLSCPRCHKKTLSLELKLEDLLRGDTAQLEVVPLIYCANWDCSLDDDDWEAGCGFNAEFALHVDHHCQCESCKAAR
jgi:hypothetical protein